MKLLKEVVRKGDKKYINYVLVVPLNNDKSARIPIEVKTFGKSWDSPSIRRAYSILSLVSELVVVKD